MRSRPQQKMYTVVLKSANVVEHYPKTEIRLRQNVRWLDQIPCIIRISTVPMLAVSEHFDQ